MLDGIRSGNTHKVRKGPSLKDLSQKVPSQKDPSQKVSSLKGPSRKRTPATKGPKQKDTPQKDPSYIKSQKVRRQKMDFNHPLCSNPAYPK